MTERKDFKRVVRARARRTGERYSSALHHVRSARPDRPAAAGSLGSHEEGRLIAITRVIPDVRSTNIDKTVRFYTEILGFDERADDGKLIGFVSATHPGVEVTLNRDGFALPPGFTVEVDGPDAVVALHCRSAGAPVRVIEELPADGSQFSVLDPCGRRVTIAAQRTVAARPGSPDATARPITRAIASVSTHDSDTTHRFYGDYLGFEVAWERAGMVMFRSPTAPGAQLIASPDVTNPDGFDLDVGTLDRLEGIYQQARGNFIVLDEPRDFEEYGIRCFLLLDPNGISVNVAALLDPKRQTPPGTSNAAPGDVATERAWEDE